MTCIGLVSVLNILVRFLIKKHTYHTWCQLSLAVHSGTTVSPTLVHLPQLARHRHYQCLTTYRVAHDPYVSRIGKRRCHRSPKSRPTER